MSENAPVLHHVSVVGRSGKKGLSALAVLLIGLAVTTAVFFQIKNQEGKEREKLFKVYAAERANSIRNGVSDDLILVKSVRSLYLSSQNVDRDEFSIFVNPIIEGSKGVQAIEWVPKISLKDRGYYQNLAIEGGLKGFSIKEIGTQGNMVNASDRPEYFPVFYIEPVKGNEKAIGFDLTSNPARKEALEKARDTGEMVASGRIDMVQDSNQEFGFLVFYPIYRIKNTETIEDRRNNISGFVIGVFRIKDLFEFSLNGLHVVGINMYVYDKTAPEDERLLFRRFADDFDGDDESETKELAEYNLYYEQVLEIGGREWVIKCIPTDKFMDSMKSWRSWTAAILGGILSIFLALYIFLMVGHTVDVEAEVERRTHDLNESESRMRAVLEKAVDAIITIGDKGTVETFNDAAEKTFGFTREEIIGKNINLIIPGPNHHKHDKYLLDYLADGKCHVVDKGREGTAVKKDGTIFPIELSVSNVKLRHRTIYSGIIRDITYRKEIEKMKNEFVSVVSHELRTPLTSIRGSLGLLAGGVMGELPEEVMELLIIARDNTNRLVVLINDILDLEKIESGKMRISPARIDIGSLITKAIDEMGGLASQNNVELKSQPVNLSVVADPDRTLQVLDNLISNAIKFSPQGMEVVISVERKNEFAVVNVKDNGPGIPDEFKDKVFQKFQQADSTVTRKKGGTGLGLSICKAIVEAQGGEIGFVSLPNSGATFHFTIPVAVEQSDIEKKKAQEPDKTLVAAPAPNDNKSKSVLIIDDNKDITKLLKILVEREKYESIIAHTGKEGVEKAIKYKPDAIILDINLPDISGFEVLKTLKQNPETEKIEVIFLSAQSKDQFGHLQVPNVLTWLDKPVDEERLIKSIRNAAREDGPPRVLVVDDDKDLQNVMRLTFKKRGFLVTCAFNGREGVAVFEAAKPDIIILDIMMPEADGFYFVDKLRDNPDFYRTPLIVFSAKELSEEEKKKLSVKATDFMTKSKTSEEDFSEATTKLLNGILKKG